MRKKLILGIILLSFSLLLLNKYWETPIDESYDCIQFVIGQESFEPITIKLKGSVYKSFFKDDYIAYTLWIGDLKYPRDNELLLPFGEEGLLISETKVYFDPTDEIESRFRSFNNKSTFPVRYEYWENEIRVEEKYNHYFNYGHIDVAEDFSKMLMTISKETKNGYSWSSTKGYSIIVSASNLNEAKTIIKEVGGFTIDE